MDNAHKKEQTMTLAQQEAVRHGNGPMMVLAGPGSGKTFVLTCRIRDLIERQKVNPGNILVVTFTRAAADQMRQRFLKMTGSNTTSVSFGTFHSIFFKIIKHAYGYQGSQIIREEQKYGILREIIRERKIPVEDEKDFIAGVLSEISIVKGEMMNLDHYYSTSCPDEVFRDIYRMYHNWMNANHMIDFDDMQLICYELFQARKDILGAWQRKYQYILVDEFQDICRIQYELVRMLAEPENNLFIVGDDDQSIYRFRGARPEIMLGFERDYPDCKKVLLDVNFRCDRNVVMAAGLVIKQNQARFSKAIKANRKGMCPVKVRKFPNSQKQYDHVVSELEKARENGQPLSEIAILYRTVRCASPLMRQLMDRRIPFQMKDVVPDLYSHFVSRNVLAYLRVAAGSQDRSDFLEIINRPNRYVNRAMLEDPQVNLQELIWKYENSDKDWMAERLQKLQVQLRVLKGLNPSAAIEYIRQAIGYETYLHEYAEYRRMKPDELIEVLDEMQETARPFETIEEFFAHIVEYQQELRDQASKRNQMIQEAVDEYGNPIDAGVVLTTMHGAKGLEYDTVYIIDANEGVVPHEKASSPEDIEEERRLFYVAMTRAKNKLFICCTKEKFNKQQEPSQFIKEFLG